MSTSDLTKKLQETLDFLKGELTQVRTGRVTPSLLDSVLVNAYGSDLTVREVGTLTVLDSHTLSVTPWDKNLLPDIENAIKNSDLGLNPVVQGASVLVPIPALTEERRKEFTRLVAEKTENVRQSIRNIRQDAMREIDSQFNSKEFGEDEKFSRRDEVEDIVRDFTSKIEEASENKKKEIMQV